LNPVGQIQDPMISQTTDQNMKLGVSPAPTLIIVVLSLLSSINNAIEGLDVASL